MMLMDGRSAGSWAASYKKKMAQSRTQQANRFAARYSSQRGVPSRPTRSSTGGGSRGSGRGSSSGRGVSRVSSGYGGGYSRNSSSSRGYSGYSTSTRSAAPRKPAKPKYAGPPPPSAAMISQLYGQMASLGRDWHQAGNQFNQKKGGLTNARRLWMSQLAETFGQRQSDMAADYANRGLAGSGVYARALQDLGKERTQQASQYDLGYNQQIDALRRALTEEQGGLKRKKSQLKDKYLQARADRARILKLMGG